MMEFVPRYGNVITEARNAYRVAIIIWVMIQVREEVVMIDPDIPG